jgi:hypothetical protein
MSLLPPRRCGTELKTETGTGIEREMQNAKGNEAFWNATLLRLEQRIRHQANRIRKTIASLTTRHEVYPLLRILHGVLAEGIYSTLRPSHKCLPHYLRGLTRNVLMTWTEGRHPTMYLKTMAATSHLPGLVMQVFRMMCQINHSAGVMTDVWLTARPGLTLQYICSSTPMQYRLAVRKR